MFNYMTPLEYVEEKADVTVEGTVAAHDAQSLLFNFLHELIVAFGTEDIVCKSMRVSELRTDSGGAFLRYAGCDRRSRSGCLAPCDCLFAARDRRGDRFSLDKHPQGTEVKAVTYSNMQITHTTPAEGAEGEWNVYVIVDI